MQSKPKVVLIGIDGASHTLIARGLQQGRLPTFRSLAAGRPPQPLLTPFPPHTAPGWTSLFTGVSPGERKIGVTIRNGLAETRIPPFSEAEIGPGRRG